ncbi:hypothetical protein BS78_02G401300 [Paspalum vaginatum]|nr:hypothetical protein BS78_02G401300 [Paspalum vaginatum]
MFGGGGTRRAGARGQSSRFVVVWTSLSREATTQLAPPVHRHHYPVQQTSRPLVCTRRGKGKGILSRRRILRSSLPSTQATLVGSIGEDDGIDRMLQRAASNAYSWWWASHIRTTQSKWLDANLQDMENRVKVMLRLLGQEADSFGKRAEMYYSTRPEVISHVEQVYRAYRALVERYDHISRELHKANHTIATSCPEEVQYAMLEQEEDHDFPKAMTPVSSNKIHKPAVQEFLGAKRDIMSAEDAHQEIGRLQKAILVLQTEKEYVKSSYESGIARCREIEKQIADTQEEICLIQDKFDAHAAIHDDEARALMAMTALRSCQGTISELARHFEELVRIAAMESGKTKSLGKRLCAMNGNIGLSSGEASSTDTSKNTRAYPVVQRILELQPICESLDSFFASASESSTEEIAENVDELVDKVIKLKLKFPKQSAQINQLKQGNENLENKMDDLQDEMVLRDDQSDLNEQLKLLENEFNAARLLERSMVDEEVSVSIGLSEIFSCIINISKALGSVGPEEDSKGDGLAQDRRDALESVNDTGNDVIHGSNNGDEENFPENCLVQQVRYEMYMHPDNRINPFDSPEIENGVDNSGEGNADTSSGVCQSLTENENGNVKFAQRKILKGEYPLEVVSQTHLLRSGSTGTLDKKYDSNQQDSSPKAAESSMQVAEGNIGDGNSFTKRSVIQEERLGDGKSQNICTQVNPVASSSSNCSEGKDSLEKTSMLKATCFDGAVKSLDSQHINEAKTVEQLLNQGGQLNAPQKIENLNKCGQVESPKQDGCISFGHVDNIQDMKNSIHVDVHSSEVRDETSLSVTAGDSEETEGSCQQVLEGVPDSEKKGSNGKELASEATTSINHSGRSMGEKFSLMGEQCVPSWQDFLLGGLEGREAMLLADYTSVLQNYKETKRRLTELEKKNQEHLEETKAVIRELRNANSMKYVEIRTLRKLLGSSEMPPGKVDDSNSFSSMRSLTENGRSNGSLDREISTMEESSFSNIESPKNTSLFEVRFRNDIDALMEENLQFLVRYSMACHHMQEFDRRYQELQNEMKNTEDKKIEETNIATEPEPAEKKLRELRTELDVWFEQNALLSQEVQLKSACLCSLQEEIAEAMCGNSEMDIARFTPYRAAKFQGEVLNMQQSNSRIESELLAASKHMRGLQAKVNNAVQELLESFEISSQRLSPLETQSTYEKQFKQFPSRTRVPLRNFLFGTKQKKKSLFACINPTLQKQFSDL